MYKDDNLIWRKVVACIVDLLYYETENRRFCHKRAHARVGRYICGVGYDSYMAYLKSGRKELGRVQLPAYVADALAVMVRLSKMPAGVRYVVRVEICDDLSFRSAGRGTVFGVSKGCLLRTASEILSDEMLRARYERTCDEDPEKETVESEP